MSRPFHEAAPYLNYTGEGRYVNRLLRSLGVEMVPAHVVDQIAEGSARGHHLYEERTVEWPADTTVLVTQRRSTDELYRDGSDGTETPPWRKAEFMGCTGSATASRRGCGGCIYDGHRLGREIDGANPRRPRLHPREPSPRCRGWDYDGFLGDRKVAIAGRTCVVQWRVPLATLLSLHEPARRIGRIAQRNQCDQFCEEE